MYSVSDDRSEFKVLCCNLVVVLKPVGFGCGVKLSWVVRDRVNVGVVQG